MENILVIFISRPLPRTVTQNNILLSSTASWIVGSVGGTTVGNVHPLVAGIAFLRLHLLLPTHAQLLAVNQQRFMREWFLQAKIITQCSVGKTAEVLRSSHNVQLGKQQRF